jgi:hypothetical protein
MRQKLQFLVEAIEVDIDERGKMVMIWENGLKAQNANTSC